MNNYPTRDLVYEIIERKPFVYAGIRKICQNLTLETKELPRLTFEEIGYGRNKLAQLKRNYIDPEEFERVRSLLRKRKDKHFTSVSLSMRGGKKDSRSMGWCMLNLVVTRGPRIETVEIQYRSTEVILKFGGDLCFLPWVFEQLGLKPDLVRFHFANAFLSGVYFPTFVSKEDDPLDFLEDLYRADRRFFASCTRFFWRSSMGPNQVFPYSPENQQHRFGWKALGLEKMQRIEKYLAKRHAKFGKPAPSPHWVKESK